MATADPIPTIAEREFASEEDGFIAVQHQQVVGASGSTEESQFQG